MKKEINQSLLHEVEQVNNPQQIPSIYSDPKKHMEASEAQDKRNKVHQRAIFGNIFVGIYILWLVFTGYFLYINLLKEPEYRLSDAVLITMLGTTLAHVISIVYIFAKYLYPGKE